MLVTISVSKNAVIVAAATPISLANMFGVSAAGTNPAYLVLTGLDRNEYNVGATGTTGAIGLTVPPPTNSNTIGFTPLSGDARGIGIVFTYEATTGRYSSSYGYLDQLSYTASASPGDVTSLSLFGTDSLPLANAYGGNANYMMMMDAGGYIGSLTVTTQPGFTAAVPAQATPASLAAVADSFIGQAWNTSGCWVLASTIAAEAGASLPVQSSAIGVPGQANGEWIVAFNGPGGQTGNWQSMVTAGDIVVIGSATGGHITTCVSGSGSTATLVDNYAFKNSLGQVTNLASVGGGSEIVIAAPHLASQEWAGVQTNYVVIYRLDTPVVTSPVSSINVAYGAGCAIGSLFAVTDPGNKAITQYQIYDTASSDSLTVAGGSVAAHTAATAATVTSLSSVTLTAGATAGTDTIDVRAYNGSYWGDWSAINVTVSAVPTAAAVPVLLNQTPAQTWLQGSNVSFALGSTVFFNPQAQGLSYTATQASGQGLPGWLHFNSSTETFSGVVPNSPQTLSLKVTAADSAGLSASETFQATVPAVPPTVANPTGTQTWTPGQKLSFTLPANTFVDPQKQRMIYNVCQSNGQALPAGLTFNGLTDTFSGCAPVTPQTLGLKVTATDTSGLSVSETFQVSVAAAAPVLAHPTAAQSWNDGQGICFQLPPTTFTDPQAAGITYAATQSNGQALPAWLNFNAATDIFSGLVPATASGTLAIQVTATDSYKASASEMFTVTFVPVAGSASGSGGGSMTSHL